MPSPQSPFSAHAVHRRRRRRHAGTATGCPTRRAPDQTRCRAPGLARNRSPWHPTALATRPGTLCSPRRRGWPATRRSTRALRPRPAQCLLGLLASPSHSPPLPRHGNPAPAPSCSRASSPSRPWRRRPRPPRRAPTPPVLDPSQAPNRLPHLPWNLPSPVAPSPPYRAAAAAKQGRRRQLVPWSPLFHAPSTQTKHANTFLSPR